VRPVQGPVQGYRQRRQTSVVAQAVPLQSPVVVPVPPPGVVLAEEVVLKALEQAVEQAALAGVVGERVWFPAPRRGC
jgi:hypothetical protein